MKIVDVCFSTGLSGYVHRDLAAIKAGAQADGMLYRGTPLSPGFRQIVEPADAVSVMLLLEDGQVAFGDCVDVILAGFGGRDPAFHYEDHAAMLQGRILPMLRDLDVRDFRRNAAMFNALSPSGERPHTAIQYGVSQALLHAAALAAHCTIAEAVSHAYGCQVATREIGLLASCQRDDPMQLDRIIIKQAALLPHASFTVPEHVGADGGRLLDYARSIASRIAAIGAPGYCPRIHLDVYGTLGEIFSDEEDLVAYLGRLAQATKPYSLLLESPIIRKSREEQIEGLRALKKKLVQSEIDIGLIADEWCNTLEDVKHFTDRRAADYLQIKTPDLGGIDNTIEALIYCREHGMGACLGGTANETDQSARITANIGLACQADFMLTKPGLGGDEGMMIMKNEMARVLALIALRGAWRN
jgi:methylaspartate ammonia-lyase